MPNSPYQSNQITANFFAPNVNVLINVLDTVYATIIGSNPNARYTISASIYENSLPLAIYQGGQTPSLKDSVVVPQAGTYTLLFKPVYGNQFPIVFTITDQWGNQYNNSNATLNFISYLYFVMNIKSYFFNPLVVGDTNKIGIAIRSASSNPNSYSLQGSDSIIFANNTPQKPMILLSNLTNGDTTIGWIAKKAGTYNLTLTLKDGANDMRLVTLPTTNVINNFTAIIRPPLDTTSAIKNTIIPPGGITINVDLTRQGSPTIGEYIVSFNDTVTTNNTTYPPMTTIPLGANSSPVPYSFYFNPLPAYPTRLLGTLIFTFTDIITNKTKQIPFYWKRIQ